MMTAIDPFTSVPQPVMTQLFSLMAAATFVITGVLDNFIVDIIMSYKLVPAGSFLHLALSEPVLFLTRAFALGLAVSIPIIVVILILQFIMGVVSKGASGFPIFVVWVPLQTAVALVLLFVMLPAIRLFMHNWTNWAVQYFTSLLTAG
jgi:flagellar biosynthetic protein FliR